MTHSPMVTGWEIYFEEKNGYDNRETVARAFSDFYENREADKIEIPGKCMLGGIVFGREGFNNDSEILTTDIKSIERIERSADEDKIPHDLMCATTVSGGKYFFYSDDFNAFMLMMLGDLLYRRKKLNSIPYYYLKPELRGSRLI